MCKVKDIETCDKKMVVLSVSGEVIESEWFNDPERKNTFGQEILTIEEERHISEICDPENILSWHVSRKREDDCIYISHHAFDRMRERNGWNKKTALRMVKKIYDNGLSPYEYKGQFAAWAKYRAKQCPNVTLKMYGNSMYVFDNNVLITVLLGRKIAWVA